MMRRGAQNQIIVVPVALILFPYGGAGAGQALGEVRRHFALAAQRAIRNLALEVFGHLHALSAVHLNARPAVQPVIERGTQGMDFLIRFTTFNILPTLDRNLMVGAIVALYDWRSRRHPWRDRRPHRLHRHPVGMVAHLRRMNDATPTPMPRRSACSTTRP